MVGMHFCRLVRPPLALLLSWLLACPALPAQQAQQTGSAAPQKAATQTPGAQTVDQRLLVKPDPKRAKKLVELGEKAEAAGAFPQALEAYEEAQRYAPFDVTIVRKGAALRARLIREYSRNAERMAIDGELDGATEQLAAALHIDPSNGTVLERMKEMESMRAEVNHQIPNNQEPPQGLAVVNPEKVIKSFRLQTDLRGAYEQVAAAYGIKASFDPDLPARNVKVHLDDVDFDTAMKVLMVETATFWTAVNPQLIFVAADTAEKRREFDPVIEQTFMLPASTATTEMTEVVRVVRELTGSQHIQQSATAHSLTIRDTVDHVRLAGQIIKDLERAPGEVLLEIDLLEVDRNAAEKLGITPPSKLTMYSVPPNLATALRAAPTLTALLTLLTQIFGTSASGGVTSLASAIPPIIAIGGGRSTFLLSLPSASADFSESLSLVQSGEQVLIRAEDGKPATFFSGERYPITLSLLSASLGAANFTPNPGGTGVTIPSQQFTVGQGPVSMVTADFRAIGAQDLAVLNEIDNTVTILLNQGSAATSQFAQATNSPISLGAARTQAPAVPASLATGSLNSNTDAFPDLLVTDPVANTVTVLLQTSAADGQFNIQPNPIKVGKEPSAIAVGTFNTNVNSNIGFVVTNFADNTYSVYTGNGDGTFTQVTGSPFALPAGDEGPYAITVADFNNDGIPDLAILNQTSANVTILEGKGNGTFTEFPKSPLSVGKTPVAIASGNLDGSTGPGLAIANQADNTVTVYLGNGDGTFGASSQSPLATSSAPSGVVIADLVQQSTGGLAVTNRDSGTVTVFVDLGSGLFTKALEPVAGTNPEAIVVGDFTGNEFPDIVVTNNLSRTAGLVTLLVTPTSLISNPATSQEPYPGSEYEDIGLKIKTTPSVHDRGEVTLQMDYDIKSLAGSSFNGIPVITNRTLTQTVRLKDGETTIVAGLLDREETRSLTGLPWLANIPGAGYAFGDRSNSYQDQELLILITPRLMRIPVRDSRTIYAGRGDARGRAGAGALGGVAPTPEPERGPGENPPPPTTPPAQETPPGQENPAAAPPPQPPQPQPQQPQPQQPQQQQPQQQQPPQNPPDPQR
jgi:Flp pilus assembly secretin CpaC/tetratricopeptide (TPR) repeat protein